MRHLISQYSAYLSCLNCLKSILVFGQAPLTASLDTIQAGELLRHQHSLKISTAYRQPERVFPAAM